MKKESFAATLLLLLFLAVLLNIRYLDESLSQVADRAEAAAQYACTGDWPAAEATADHALELWTDLEKYAHIVLRHAEVTAAAEALSDLWEAVLLRDAARVRGADSTLALRLESILNTERITFGSIF